MCHHNFSVTTWTNRCQNEHYFFSLFSLLGFRYEEQKQRISGNLSDRYLYQRYIIRNISFFKNYYNKLFSSLPKKNYTYSTNQYYIWIK